MKKIKLHYANINLTGDIPLFEFNNGCSTNNCITCDNTDYDDFKNFIIEIFKQQDGNKVYLFCDELNRIFISDDTDFMFEFIENLQVYCNEDYEYFLFECSSYEEAYKTALPMNERNKLCYEK